MEVSFSGTGFHVDHESKCYSREGGCFFEILRNLASFSFCYLMRYKYHVHLQ